jgi:hypothetical protein
VEGTRLICAPAHKSFGPKLTAIRDFVLWWDGVEKNPGTRGQLIGPGVIGRDSTVTAKEAPPVAGEGGLPPRKQIERWRKAVSKPENFKRALADAQHRCRRICEQEKAGTVRGTEGTGEFERGRFAPWERRPDPYAQSEPCTW